MCEMGAREIQVGFQRIHKYSDIRDCEMDYHLSSSVSFRVAICGATRALCGAGGQRRGFLDNGHFGHSIDLGMCLPAL